MTKRQQWFADRKNKIISLRKQGLKYREIASILHLTISIVRFSIKRKIYHQKPRPTKNRITDLQKYEIFLRDMKRCRQCYKRLSWEWGDYVIHHIDFSGSKETQNNDPSNLVTLCQKCHLRFHVKHRKDPKTVLHIHPIITRKEDKVERIFLLD